MIFTLFGWTYRNMRLQICVCTPRTTCTYIVIQSYYFHFLLFLYSNKCPKWNLYKICTLFKAHNNEHEAGSHAKVTYPIINGSSCHPPIHLDLPSTTRPRLQVSNITDANKSLSNLKSPTSHPKIHHLCTSLSPQP